MTEAQKHPYDRTGLFVCWRTPKGFAVEVADEPGKRLEVTTRDAQLALRWGTDAGIAAGERAAEARRKAASDRERETYARNGDVAGRGLQTQREPLTGFEVAVAKARFWIAAPNARAALSVLVHDRKALADPDNDLAPGVAIRALTADEQRSIRMLDEYRGSPTTFADVVAQLNDLRAPPMLCAESRTAR